MSGRAPIGHDSPLAVCLGLPVAGHGRSETCGYEPVTPGTEVCLRVQSSGKIHMPFVLETRRAMPPDFVAVGFENHGAGRRLVHSKA